MMVAVITLSLLIIVPAGIISGYLAGYKDGYMACNEEEMVLEARLKKFEEDE